MRNPLNRLSPVAAGPVAAPATDYDDHAERSRQAQRRADKWLIAGTVLMGMTLPGIIGLPLFLRGLALQRKAAGEGLSVRPIIVTLIGYMVFLDAALNCFGWALDTFAANAVLWQTMIMGWGGIFDAGYFWHYNQIPWVSGAGAPGEKAWEITCVLTVFAMRMAACIGLLQMKRWGHQWMIVTCWFGLVIWIGYTTNMTIFADLRYAHVAFPVIGWWLYDIFYITPFLSIPYLHTVNREIFSD
jgi:hypothetical protein